MSGFITQMVSPAVIISAVGLLLLSLNNRYLTITGRVRNLNSEALKILNKESKTKIETQRFECIKTQMVEMLQRCHFIKRAIFILYLALTFCVLTILTLAGDMIGLHSALDSLSLVWFIIALLLLLTALLLEGWEMKIALKQLKFDAEQTFNENI